MRDVSCKIAVDIRGWERRGRGIDLYTLNVLSRWLGKPGVELTLLAPRRGDVPPVPVNVARLSLGLMLLAKLGVSSQIRSIERQHDALFLPNLTVYAGSARAPVVVTVHDATALLHPQFFTTRDRVWHWLVNVDRWLHRADRVLANSEQTRREILDLGVPPERVSVIYHGIGEEYKPAASAVVRETLERYGLSDRPYFLFLGAVERRKNVRALIRGFAHAQRKGLDARLVLAGPVREAEQLEGATEDVRVLGWVDAADKPGLYTGAAAAVSLAKHEGFGMLPLEALACGTRSILSRLPVYEETIGERAVYVDSDDPDTVADALLQAQQSPAPLSRGDIDELRQRFSWDTCAEETFRAIIDLSSRPNVLSR